MKQAYKILLAGGEGEVIEKKSRFIAVTSPAESEEEALQFIEEIRKKYWDARHHCSAYLIGPNHETKRANDDGEPSMTAGKPMMDVLLGEEVHDVCVVVTRYFGGTLLGTGGLIRAYSKAAKAALDQSTVIEKIPAVISQVMADYNDLGRIKYLCAQSEIPILTADYAEKAVLELLIPETLEGVLSSKITEATNGKVRLEEKERLWYGYDQKELKLFR